MVVVVLVLVELWRLLLLFRVVVSVLRVMFAFLMDVGVRFGASVGVGAAIG